MIRGAAAAALLLCACRSSTPAVTVICLGDSITAGQGAEVPWPRVLERRSGGRVRAVNLGVSGDTTAQMLERFRAGRPSRADWVIVLGGINDVYRRVPPAETKRHLIAIWEEARATGARVAAVTLLPDGGAWVWTPAGQTTSEEISAFIRDEAGRRRLTLIDARAAFASSEDPRRLAHELDSGDHLHPGQRGADRLAELVGAVVLQ